MHRIAAVAFSALVLATSSAGGQQQDSLSNPFHGFETRVLANGLKVWFKYAPGLPDVAVSITLPYGADQDPAGYRQLAHFTEHMLFTDRSGLSELEFKSSLDLRGGQRNGYTFNDHTGYFAHVRREHGLFALQWIYTLLTPPRLSPELIDRQRTPVLLEVAANKPGPFDRVAARLLNPASLRPPGYWRREFDLPSEWERDDDTWTSVQRIDSAAVRAFLEKYYVPSRLTLTVIGDIRADSVWSIIGRTFATLPPANAPPPLPTPRDPGRERRTYNWRFDQNVGLTYRFKRYEPGARDNITTSFVERYLSRRLNERLRFGSRKAVYGIIVVTRARGKASELLISAHVKPSEAAYARSVIEAELDSLRKGTVTDAEFTKERDIMLATLRTSFSTAADIDHLVLMSLYNRDVYSAFPDFVTEFGGLTRAEVVRHARQLLDPSRTVIETDGIVPVPESAVVVLCVVLVGLLLFVARAALIRPLPMTSLRYVARIRRGYTHRLVVTSLIVASATVLLRVAFYPVHALYLSSAVLIPSIVIQWGLAALVAVVPFGVGLAIRASLPAKVLVFERCVAIKAYGYRSVLVPAGQVTELSFTRLPELVRRIGMAGVLRTRIMTPALLAPALFLQRADGRAWLFRSRDMHELMTVLGRATGVTAPTDAASDDNEVTEG